MSRPAPKYTIGERITDGRSEFEIDREPVWNELLKDWLYLDPCDPEWSSISGSEAEIVMVSDSNPIIDTYKKALNL